ncbi:hypothetical protein H312_00409, partial [Anncaliia algerae PRA339]
MNITHRELVGKTVNLAETIKWLQEIEVIPVLKNCIKCLGGHMRLIEYKNTFRWKCKACSTAPSIFKDTIFFNNKLDLARLLDLAYYWSQDLNQQKVMHELKFSGHKTISKWYNKLQKLSYIILKENSRGRIGGPGHVIEIDESKFSKRKYNVGRIPRSPWVVGGIDINTRE